MSHEKKTVINTKQNERGKQATHAERKIKIELMCKNR